ncbi:Facilitated trehalose transporter Tret1 [Chamberlinius hualienensis]
MGCNKLFEREFYKPIIYGLFACLSNVASGNVISYPSPAVPDINSHKNPYYVNRYEQSWIGSLVPLGAIFGGVVGGPIMDRFGRKLALMFSVIPFTVGWVIIISSQHIGAMYAGRFICGISLGLTSGVSYVYVAETAPSNLRGSLCSLVETFFNFGVMLIYILGYFLSWQWIGVACLVILVFEIIGCYMLPETPRWLLIQSEKCPQKNAEACQALQQLRGLNQNVEDELKEIKESIMENAVVAPWKDYIKKICLKNMAICLALLAVQQFNGNTSIKIYTVSIFEDAGTTLDENLETIIIGCVSFIGCLSCVFTIDSFGRRNLLIVSTSMVAISMVILGAYYKVKENNVKYALDYMYWVPLFSLVLNSYFCAAGLGPIALSLPSELFPTDLRGKSNAICVAWFELCCFIAAKFLVNLSDAIGEAESFWVMAGFGVIGCIISIFAVPETKKMTLK